MMLFKGHVGLPWKPIGVTREVDAFARDEMRRSTAIDGGGQECHRFGMSVALAFGHRCWPRCAFTKLRKTAFMRV